MRQFHDCKFKDILYDTILKRWVCVKCSKRFTDREMKLLKDYTKRKH